MLPPTAVREIRRRVDQAGRTTKLSVLYLLGQSLYAAKRGNTARSMAYFAASLAALKFRWAGVFIEGALFADRARRNLQP